LDTSFVGSAPDGGVTVGSFERAPLVGVVAGAVEAGVDVEVPEVVDSPATCGTELTSDSFPTVMVLVSPEPQPMTTVATPRASRAEARRGRRAVGKLMVGGD
jgi:hypothetical protein